MKAIRNSIIIVLVFVFSSFFAINAIAKTAVEVFQKASPSVVVVQAQAKNGKYVAFGSGVVMSNGDVVTNCHIIEDALSIKVKHGEKDYDASTQYVDLDRDVCSLSVPSMKAPAVSVGNTKTLKVGSRIYAIGAPQGLTLTFSEGIISSLRPVEGGQYLQITAPISPGSSGGGLFDEEGRLIGLTTFYLKEGQQLNFAVPVEWIGELPQRHNKKLKTTDTYSDWLMQSIVFEEEKDWKGLENHSLKRIKIMPKDAYAWYALGIAYYKLGQPAKSIEAYQQALRINPEAKKAWNNIGFTYSELGQNAKAIEAYQQALRINPEDYVAWYNLGNAYAKSGLTAKAIELYKQALRLNPEYINAWNNLGVAYDDSGQNAKAIEAYQQALRINPEADNVWTSLGIVYGKSGQNAQAIEAFKKAIRINSEDAIAWYSLGIVYDVSGQKGKAMEVYKRLKSINPSMAEEYFNKVILP